MSKIKLLYIITKLELGGAQKQLLSLIDSLDKEKFDIFLFTGWDGLLLEDALRINGIRINRSLLLDRPINPLRDFFSFIEIYLFIKRNRIQIIHTHSSKAGIIGRLAAGLAKVEVIVHTVHGWSFNDYQSKIKRKFFIWLEKLSANFTDKIIVVSNSDRKRGLENQIGKEDKYLIIRYGIDYTQFEIKDDSIRKELQINRDNLLVGMVSCFKPQKSPQDFIKLAFLVHKNIPNVKFLLVGDGILRAPIEKSIRRLNLEQVIILTGWRRDISRILASIDVFVLTSLWEGLPISALEAMAASVPVIATDTGGISEIISDGETGFLVPPHDLKELSQKLLLLLKDKNLRVRMANRAKESLGYDFRTENMAANIQNIYNDLIK